MKRLLLLGGGHAHLAVLRLLAQEPLDALEVIMVTPQAHQAYSGMLPGWMTGHYTQQEAQIDLRPLLLAAKVELVLSSAVGIDADRRCVALADHRHLEYDFLSIDIGCEIDVSWLETAGDKLLPVKPLNDFFKAWPQLLEDAQQKTDFNLIIVGAGAAGVELALAARFVFIQKKIAGQVQLVVSDSGLLKDHSHAVQNKVKRRLSKSGVILHQARAVGCSEGVLLADGRTLHADRVIAATGSRPPVFLRAAKLAIDSQGHIAVNQFHQSSSHPQVFAAGDICARTDTLMARSGVHAVHAGPVLAHNLLAIIAGKPLKPYQPRSNSLYLLSCGARYAIASWGSFSAQGEWVWHWKDWIDRRFIRRFQVG